MGATSAVSLQESGGSAAGGALKTGVGRSLHPPLRGTTDFWTGPQPVHGVFQIPVVPELNESGMGDGLVWLPLTPGAPLLGGGGQLPSMLNAALLMGAAGKQMWGNSSALLCPFSGPSQGWQRGYMRTDEAPCPTSSPSPASHPCQSCPGGPASIHQSSALGPLWKDEAERLLQ